MIILSDFIANQRHIVWFGFGLMMGECFSHDRSRKFWGLKDFREEFKKNFFRRLRTKNVLKFSDDPIIFNIYFFFFFDILESALNNFFKFLKTKFCCVEKFTFLKLLKIFL